MKSSTGASQQANQWAQKKKEQMEKAAQLRAERKQLATTGEMALGAKSNYGMMNEILDIEKPPSQHSQKQQYMQSDYGNNNYRQQFVPQQYQSAEDVFQQVQPNIQSSLGKQQAQLPSQKYANSNTNNKPPSQEGYRKQQPQSNYQQQQNSKAQEDRHQYGQPNSKEYEYQQYGGQQQTKQQPPKQQPRQPYQQPNRPPSGRQDQLDFVKPSNQPPRRNEIPSSQTSAQLNNQRQTQGRNPPPYNQQRQPVMQQPYNPIDDIPIKKGENPFNMNPANPEPLYECSKGCGRSFTRNALQKHEKICVKVFQKQRKPFDAQKHRIVSNEQMSHIKNQDLIDKKYEKALKKKEDWKKQSEAFRAVVKAAKGGKLTAAQQNAVKEASQMNLIPCDYCGRRFNEQAAQKHIPYCAAKSKIPPRQPQKRR